MLSQILKDRKLQKYNCYGIAFLSMAGIQPVGQQTLYVEVVSKDTKKPLDSTIEVHKNGSWTALGITKKGRFRTRLDCAEVSMLRANPKDKAYRRSTPVHCSQQIAISLNRVGPSKMSAIEKEPCTDGLQAYSFAAHRLAKTFDNPNYTKTSDFTFSITGTSSAAQAQQIWVRTKASVELREMPSDNSLVAFAVAAGTELVPTNQTSGKWWEVSDTAGKRSGWIKEDSFVLIPDKFGKPSDCPCMVKPPRVPAVPGAVPGQRGHGQRGHRSTGTQY